MTEHWTKTKDGWRDNRTGLIWLPKEEGIYTYREAMRLENESKRLPTIGELRMAWEHGARDVMDDWDHWFWSSSLVSGYPYRAHDFVGVNGYIDYSYRDLICAVRCVARR